MYIIKHQQLKMKIYNCMHFTEQKYHIGDTPSLFLRNTLEDRQQFYDNNFIYLFFCFKYACHVYAYSVHFDVVVVD